MALRKVLFLEFNEITRTIIDPLIEKGHLPTFARLFAEGTTATPESVDLPPQLDPWITWVTVHTGVDRSVHGATVLEQDADTIRAKRTWDYATEAGMTVGVFGSIGAYPPRPVRGFMIPGPFAPTDAVFPDDAAPIQRLNRRYTKVHHHAGDTESPLEMAKTGLGLLRLGLEPSACAAALAQLVRERIQPTQRWRRVTLQPLLNVGFFEKLYRRHRPHFATWHTNHAAHLMHHYWRAHDDRSFLVPSPPEEKAAYGRAVTFGYEVCDALLARFMKLVDDDTVLVLASSMGQQPYVKDAFPEGRIVVRFRDVHRVLRILGAEGVTEVFATMVPQWNLRVPDAEARARLRDLFVRATCVGGPRPNAFSVEETGEILTVTPGGLARSVPDLRYFFPGAPNARADGYALDELFVCDTPTPKEGMHHPTGVLALWGRGIERGLFLPGTTNLDIAPTVLSLLGIEPPAIMKGRVLREAWGEQPSSGLRAAERTAAA